MAKIVHFEIPADDMDRAKRFYTELFGWKIVPYEGNSEYWLISAEEENAVEGGMMKRQHPGQPIVNYVDIPSVEDHMKKVRELGGEVVVPKMPVPGMGYFAVCRDTENNMFGLWEEDPTAAVFRDAAEVFAAIVLAVVASDEKYSVDEMRTLWEESEKMEIFEGKDFKELETRVLSYFDQKAPALSPFTAPQLDMVFSSAKNMLGPELREQALETAIKAAFSEKTMDGYLLMEPDEREGTVLERIRKEFDLPEQKIKDVIEEMKKSV